jgi:hypothetical protein
MSLLISASLHVLVLANSDSLCQIHIGGETDLR